MVSRKLNVLRYAFTGNAETLQSGSLGSVSNRKVLYNVSI